MEGQATFPNHLVPLTVSHHGSLGGSRVCTMGMRSGAWLRTVLESQPSMSASL